MESRGKAYWSDVPSRASSKYSIREETLVTYVECLVDNIYVSIGTRVYIDSVWAFLWAQTVSVLVLL